MNQPPVVNLSTQFDGLKLGRFHVVIIALCFVTLFVDGMDFATVLVTAPAILNAWHLEQSAMGIVFGAGNFGLFVGALAFGFVGDRYGRRVGLIAGVLTYSLPALATGFASNVNELLALRVLAALGIGGVLPNAIAYLTESAPRRFRASFVIVALVGTSLGAGAAGGLAAGVVPTLGWQAVFFTVGVLGTALAVLLYVTLQESIPFLAINDPNAPALRQRVERLFPALRLGPETRFLVERPPTQKAKWRQLFQGPFRVVTPLFAVIYFAEGLTFMTLISWMPVLLVSAGVAPTLASIAFGYGAASGIVTRLLLGRVLDRYGALAVVGSAVAALAAFVYLGSASLSATLMIAAMVFATAFATAAHDGLNAIVGGFYPTEIRANGVGLASGIGRLAAIVGPVTAGYMLSAQFPFATIMYAVGAPYLVVIVVGLVLSFRSGPPDAREAVGTPALG